MLNKTNATLYSLAKKQISNELSDALLLLWKCIDSILKLENFQIILLFGCLSEKRAKNRTGWNKPVY